MLNLGIWDEIDINNCNDPAPEKIPVPKNNSLTTTGRGLKLEIKMNHLPKMIKQLTQHLWWFRELLSWRSNEDDRVGDIFNFISYSLSKIDTRPKKK